MKRTPFFTVSLAALLFLVAVSGAGRPDRQAGVDRQRREGDPDPTGTALSEAEASGLIHLREEEKLARDVYLAMAAIYADPVFLQIAASESRHMEAVRELLVKYRLPDPVVKDEVGAFTSEEFGALFDMLVKMGAESLVDAYMVGALIEEMDIYDLRVALEDVTHADIRTVYENLMRGSRNHLRAFAARLKALDVTYEAVYLDQEEFDGIANSPVERGGQGPRRRGR